MNKDNVTMRTYGGITLTHYSSSDRISVKVSAENAVMDASQMLGFLWAAGRLQPELAEAWDEGHEAGWNSRDDDVSRGWVPSGVHESDAENPYRKAVES